MRQETKEALKSFMKKFLEDKLRKAKDYSLDTLRKAYPFHDLFFRDEALIAFKLQRSIVTSMGAGFYPKLAQIIAKERFKEVNLNYEIDEDLGENICNKIELIITQLREGGRRTPNHLQEMKEILSTKGGKHRKIKIIADLYIGDIPLFVEIKSPLPNLDVCAESKKKILYFLAIMEKRSLKGEAYLAFPYNPFIKREKYKHSYTKKIMDLEKEVLIGEEFWDKIGGRGTFEELLNIINEVKKEIPLLKRRGK